MSKKQLIEDIKINPARFYHLPSDVLRDRRFSDPERLQILEAWERDARGAPVGSRLDSGPLESIVAAREDIQRKIPAGAVFDHERN